MANAFRYGDSAVRRKQREAAVKVLMRAVHMVESAQNRPSVRACRVDQSRLNEAKDLIYRTVQDIEKEG